MLYYSEQSLYDAIEYESNSVQEEIVKVKGSFREHQFTALFDSGSRRSYTYTKRMKDFV